MRTLGIFDDSGDFEWLRGAAVELHCSFRVSLERLDHTLQFEWATDLWENIKQAVSTDKIKRLSEINECDVHGHMMFSALIL